MLEQDPDSEATYYLILRGVDRFFTEFSALPGALADQVEPDISHLKNCVSKVNSSYRMTVDSTVCVKDCGLHRQIFQNQNFVYMFSWLTQLFNCRKKLRHKC